VEALFYGYLYHEKFEQWHDNLIDGYYWIAFHITEEPAPSSKSLKASGIEAVSIPAPRPWQASRGRKKP